MSSPSSPLVARRPAGLSAGDARPAVRSIGVGIALALLAVLQVWAVCDYFSPSQLFTPNPIYIVDWLLHQYDVDAAVEFLKTSWRSWGYDPTFMAGYPESTINDVDLNLIQLLVLALNLAGVSTVVGFKLIVFVAFLSFPFWVFGAAKNLGMPSWAACTAAFLDVVYWKFAYQPVNMSYFGMVSFLLAAHAGPYVLTVLHCFVERPTVRGWWALTLLTAALFYGHILGPMILIPGALLLVGTNWRSLGPRWLATLVVSGVVAIALNVHWLVPFLQFFGMRENEGLNAYYATPGFLEGLRNYFNLFGPDSPLNVNLRLGGFLLTLLGVGLAPAIRGNAVLALLASIVGLLTVANLPIPALANMQPNRFQVPADVFLLLGSAAGLARLAAMPRHWTPAGIAAVALVALFLVPAFKPMEYADFLIKRRTGLNFRVPDDVQQVAAWLSAHTSPEARVAFENEASVDSIWAATRSGRQTIGGPYRDFYMVHSYASFPEGRPFERSLDTWEPQALLREFDHYNATTAVVYHPSTREYFRRRLGLSPVATFGRFEAFRLPISPNYFLVGQGKVVAVALDTISLSEVRGEQVVLKFHWVPGLGTDPPCRIERRIVGSDPVGFIELVSPPPTVTIKLERRFF